LFGFLGLEFFEDADHSTRIHVRLHQIIPAGLVRFRFIFL
jgi:hypothetical protein